MASPLLFLLLILPVVHSSREPPKRSTERSPKPKPVALTAAGSSAPDPSPLASYHWETTTDTVGAVGRPIKRNAISSAEAAYVISRNDGGDVQDGDSSEEVVYIAKESHAMFLCDHPPKKFSPQFKPTLESCPDYMDHIFLAPTTKSLCADFHWRIYGKRVTYQWLPQVNETSLQKFNDEKFNAMCLPLFRRFNQCEERKFLTICRDERVLFFHSHSCRRPSQEDRFFTNLLISSLMQGEEDCFRLICSGVLRVVDYNVSGVKVRLMNLDYRYGKGKLLSCQHLFNPFYGFQPKRKKVRILANTHFPCCYMLYLVLWAGDPKEHGLNEVWDFLPMSCQVSQLLLLVVALSIGAFGAVGNMAVLAVMASGVHGRSESSTLRTSLALSDFLLNLFVVIPSVADKLSLIVLGELISDRPSLVLKPLDDLPDLTFFSEVNVEGGGYRLFQALVMGTCSTVSLFSLFLLSVERFILTERGLAYKEYCTGLRATILVILTWIVALSDTLIFTYDDEGKFTPVWSNFNMFTVGVSRMKSGSLLLSKLYYFRLSFLALTCASTFVFSLLATVNFVREQARVAEELRSLHMRVLGPISQENRHIVTTMVLMTVLFPMSVVPVGVCTLFQEIYYFFDSWELFNYVSWWMFLAASAWNPWVYNMRSIKFRKDLRATVCKMVPRVVREKLGLRVPPSLQMKRDWTTEASEGQMKMLRTLGLTCDSEHFNEHQE